MTPEQLDELHRLHSLALKIQGNLYDVANRLLGAGMDKMGKRVLEECGWVETLSTRLSAVTGAILDEELRQAHQSTASLFKAILDGVISKPAPKEEP